MAHLDPEVLDEAWLLYKETGVQQYRNRLILHYTSLVAYVAKKVAAGLPAMVDREDLVSYGTFGLIDAIDKFDLDKGVKFETYAIARIRGAIIDEIRSLDWVPRSVRSKVRDVTRAKAEVEAHLGRPATQIEVAQHLGLSLEEYSRLLSQANVTTVESSNNHYADDNGFENAEYGMTPDPIGNPEDLFGVAEVTNIVGSAIDEMDERSKLIVALYYFQEMTLAEIGEVLGVTESRVCQLQSKALQSLRTCLGQSDAA